VPGDLAYDRDHSVFPLYFLTDGSGGGRYSALIPASSVKWHLLRMTSLAENVRS